MNNLQNLKSHLSCCGVIIITGAISFSLSNRTFAQIASDNTLPINSSVNLSGNTRTITGGSQAGGNLFHSFSEFSVPNNTEAYFNNAVDVNNIITRVTGGSISNIDGLIRANGQANLFLMNPNGIIFGPGARLDIGGSFIGTTASSMNFADGFSFNATATDTKPLLTISAPIGLGMGLNPGEIKVQSPGSGINFDDLKKAPVRPEGGQPIESSALGLSVKPGKNLGLLGGNISVEGGIIRAPEGQIEIGSVGSNARVSFLGEVWKLGYEGVTSFGDILFSNQAFANAANGGGISLRGRNINITGGSILLADTLGDRNAGDINFVGDSVSFNEAQVGNSTFGSGNSGKINVSANNSITIENRGGIGNNTNSTGNAGEINFKANSIIVRNNSSGVGSLSYKDALGQAGKIKVETNSLTAENAGFATTSFGSGKPGEIDIQVTGELKLSGQGASITSWTAGSAKEGGIIKINANSMIIESKSGVSTDAIEGTTGNAGSIKIQTNDFRAITQAGVSSQSKGSGHGGLVNINAVNSLTLNNGGFIAETKGEGNAGTIDLQAGQITLKDFGVRNRTLGLGKGGTINIRANNSLDIQAGDILSTTNGAGDAGTINIFANNFTLNRAKISTDAEPGSTGKAGEININVRESFTITEGPGVNSTTQGSGDGGRINIDAGSLVIRNTGVISSTERTGNAGAISIKVGDLKIREGQIRSTTKLLGERAGDGGLVNIIANSMSLDNAGIFLGTEGTGNAGEVNIQVGDLVMINTSGIKSETGATDDRGQIPASGNGGNINIIANNIRMNNRAAIAVGGKKGSTGRAGDINMTVNGSLELTTNEPTGPITPNESIASPSRTSIIVQNEGTGDAGTLNLTARSILLDNSRINGASSSGNGGSLALNVVELLQLRNNSRISTSAGTEQTPSGNGGDITINTPNGFIVAFGQDNDITANAYRGSGGKVNITAKSIFGMEALSWEDLTSKLGTTDPKKINETSLPSNDITAISLTGPDLRGQVNINTPEVDPSSTIVEFPVNIVDSSNLIATACAPGSMENQASFISTGRSGLPATPTEALQDASTLQSWVKVPQGDRGGIGEMRTQRDISQYRGELVEATGWVVDKSGKVHLIAQGNRQNSWQNSGCSVSNVLHQSK